VYNVYNESDFTSKLEELLRLKRDTLDVVGKFWVKGESLKKDILQRLDIAVSYDSVELVLGYREQVDTISKVGTYFLSDDSIEMQNSEFEHNVVTFKSRTVLVNISGIRLGTFWDRVFPSNIVFMVLWPKAYKSLAAAFGFLHVAGLYHATKSGAPTRGEAQMTGYGFIANGYSNGKVK